MSGDQGVFGGELDQDVPVWSTTLAGVANKHPDAVRQALADMTPADRQLAEQMIKTGSRLLGRR